MADDEPRGMQLSDKQLVFVFMSATVAAVVVFLFGVFVGRGVQQARGPMPGNGMTATLEVAPDGQLGETPAADSAQPAPGAGPGTTELSYPERLGRTPPDERLKPAPAESRPKAAEPPDVPDEAPPPSPSASAPLASPSSTPPAAVPGEAPWTVQVAAVKRREEAEAIAKGLKTKGYDAFVFVPDGSDRVGGFRVRIGSFKDKRSANMLAERLLRDDKRYKPWVTR